MTQFNLDKIDVDDYVPEDFEPTPNNGLHRYKFVVTVWDMDTGTAPIHACQNYAILSDIDMITPAAKRGIFQSVFNSFVNHIVKNLK